MTALDQMILPAAEQFLNLMCARLASQPNPPAECCLRVGDVAQDAGEYEDKCCSGLAWVRVTGIFPTGVGFPNPETDFPVDGCGTKAWGVTLQVGVFRCAPVGTAARGPSCEEWTAATVQVLDDDHAVRLALCDLIELKDPGTVSIGQWADIGPIGGCTGGYRTVVILVDECECLEA